MKQDDGWRLPDELWAKMQPLLPPRPEHPLGCHNPRVDDRRAMDAIVLVLRTGMQWQALKATGICHPSSAYRRFREWAAAGVFREFWRQGLLAYAAVAGVHWKWLALDGANVNDHKLMRPTLQSLPVQRPRPGARQQQGLCVDKGYDYDEVRALAHTYGFTLHQPRRGEPHQPLEPGGPKKARRWVVERTHSWIRPVPSSAGALGEA